MSEKDRAPSSYAAAMQGSEAERAEERDKGRKAELAELQRKLDQAIAQLAGKDVEIGALQADLVEADRQAGRLHAALLPFSILAPYWRAWAAEKLLVVTRSLWWGVCARIKVTIASVGQLREAELAAAAYRPKGIRRRARYLIWSNEHRAWWRPDRAGYTQEIAEAGRYTRAQAIRICRQPIRRKDEPFDELPILEMDVLQLVVDGVLSTSEGPGAD